MYSRVRRAALVVLSAVLVLNLVDSVPAEARDSDWNTLVGQKEPSIPAHPVPLPLPRPVDPEKTNLKPPDRWPAVVSAEVTLRAPSSTVDQVATAKVPGAPITVAAPQRAALRAGTPATVKVDVLDRAVADRAGLRGPLLRLRRSDGGAAAAPVALRIDYSSFRGAYGGDWAARLRWYAVPDCALTTPTVRACAPVPVEGSRNDVGSSTLVADVPAQAGGSLFAALSGASGVTGSFKATSLSASATWQAGSGTGEFSWSYPLRVPPSLGGPEPDISFAYSSGSVDAKTSSTNNQPSWIGEGFEFWPGFIERRYGSCGDDVNGADPKTGDQCWVTDNATISLNGKGSELVRDGATGVWRLESDDGSRVERLTGAVNGDNDGEYWKVTTVDGTQYFFGRNRLPGWSGQPETRSTWTTPVVGNHVDEPCHGATFATSFCDQAWRWNLDHVIDTHGNVMVYYYFPETNRYDANLGATQRSYTRGGALERIEYGLRAGEEYTTAPAARIVFTSAERCLAGSACAHADYPDVPWDQDCPSGACTNLQAPSFWTTKRLATVTTQVRAGLTYADVDQWTLDHTFPDSGDSTTTPALWLNSIVHTGKLNGQSTAMPPVTFDGAQLDNQVPSVAGEISKVRKRRVLQINNETDGQLAVTYSAQECSSSNRPAAAETNDKRCFPVRWVPPGLTERTDYFHKYVVTKIEEIDRTAVATGATTEYEYVGLPAWHFDDDDGLSPVDKKTWSQWRGYGTVRTRTGNAGDGRTLREITVFRGMDGDKASPSGGTKSVTLPALLGLPAIADNKRFQGMTRESKTFLGDGGAVLSDSVNEPWVSSANATVVRPWATLTATYADTKTTVVKQTIGASSRTTRSDKTFDSYGMVTKIADSGDIAVTGDEECNRVTYARNSALWLMNFSVRSEQYALDCAAVPATGEVASQDSVLADTRTYYDYDVSSPSGPVFGAAPSKGDVTYSEDVKTWSASGRTYLNKTKIKTDVYGRGVESWDVLGGHSTTSYTPATGGPVTSVTQTNPLGFATTTILEPGNGQPLAQIDVANNRRTDLSYDGLGRLTGSWLPGRDKAANPTSPSARFDYAVSNTAPSAVTTWSVRADGSYGQSVDIFDGLLRHRQTQLAAPGGGRVVSDTYYNSRGDVVKQNAPFWNVNAPSTVVSNFLDIDVPSQTRTAFDGAGRPTIKLQYANNVEKSRTVTSYLGDRVDITPPAGETATTAINDALGRTTELREYTAATPTGASDSTTYTYNRRGEQTRVTDVNGNKWEYQYDFLGRMIGVDDPDLGHTTYDYFDSGLLKTSSNATGTLAYEYDAVGRPSKLHAGTVAGPVRAAWTYDALAGGKGALTSSTRYDGADAYTSAVTGYDAAGRPTGASVTLPPSFGSLANTYSFDVTYDAVGNPVTVTSPAMGNLPAETETTTYDSFGLPSTLTSGLGTYVSLATFSPYAEPTLIQTGVTPRRVKVAYGYDALTRDLVKITGTREGGAGKFIDTTYSYDATGNVKQIADATTGIAADTQCFTYDNLRRLTQAWTPGNGDCNQTPSAAAMGGPAPYWQTWQYDKLGNRTQQVQYNTAVGNTTTTYVPGTAKPHSLASSSTVDSLGTHNLTYGYDGAGNLTSRGTPSGTTQTLTWDAEGHLASVTEPGKPTSSYVYDVDGNRLVRTDGTLKTAYFGNTELRSDGTATRYYSFAGRPIGARTGAGLTWTVGDSQGSCVVTLNAANTAQINRQRFTPFGEKRGTAPASWPDDHGYIGGVSDATGLTHLGAREYDPTTGRFASLDPVKDQSDPQQLHGYAYANNNPTTYSDPSGLKFIAGNEDDGSGYGVPAATPQTAEQKEAEDFTKKSVMDVVLEAGGEILLEVLGINDIKNCFTNGDVMACVSMVVNFIPWGKLFKLPKVIKGIEKAFKAVKAFYEKMTWAKKIVSETRAAARAAREAAAKVGRRIGRGGAHAADEGAEAAAGRAGREVAEETTQAAEKQAGDAIDTATDCMHSFDPRTSVLMADGTTKPIADVKVGDEVTSTDPTTGATTAKPVVQLHNNNDEDLADVTITNLDTGETSTLHTTWHHPFWNADAQAWTDAEELKPGDHLTSPDGATAQMVTAIKTWTGLQWMRDLTVDEIHSYYVLVNQSPVLVHNCTPKVGGPLPDYGQTSFYALVNDKTGTILKWGISDNPLERYTCAYLEQHGARMQILKNFDARADALEVERFMVKRHPGPLNREKFKGSIKPTQSWAEDLKFVIGGGLWR